MNQYYNDPINYREKGEAISELEIGPSPQEDGNVPEKEKNSPVFNVEKKNLTSYTIWTNTRNILKVSIWDGKFAEVKPCYWESVMVELGTFNKLSPQELLELILNTNNSELTVFSREELLGALKYFKKNYGE